MLQWQELTLCYRSTKFILDNVSGTAYPHQVNAILGPSGSGKTSLVKVIGRRLVAQRKLSLEGNITLKGRQVTRDHLAFVEQENFFFPFLTVEEILRFAVDLRYGHKKSKDHKDHLVRSTLQLLSLELAAMTRVGNEMIKGISGGEKKRLAIAVELIDDIKECLILDEPTTGLDSYQALQVVQLLSSLRDKKLILFTIHQPRSSIVTLLDRVIFLNRGKVVYQGPGNQVVPYLESLGFSCPSHFNPFDFCLDVISQDSLVAGKDLAISYQQWSQLHMEGGFQHSSFPGEISPSSGYTPPWAFYILFKRSLQQIFRNNTSLKIKVVLNILLSFLIGSFYVKDPVFSYQKVQNKTGFLYLTTTNQAFGTVFGAINLFVAEKNMILPEIENGKYRSLAYYLGRIISDLPFTCLGPIIFGGDTYFIVHLRKGVHSFFRYLLCLLLTATTASSIAVCVSTFASTPEIASALITPFNIIFFIFAGVFLNLNNLPVAFRWISKISYIKWAFEALMINEFQDQVFSCLPEEQSMCIPEGNQVLQSYGFGDNTFWDCVLYLFLLNIAFWALGYGCFLWVRRKFL